MASGGPGGISLGERSAVIQPPAMLICSHSLRTSVRSAARGCSPGLLEPLMFQSMRRRGDEHPIGWEGPKVNSLREEPPRLHMRTCLVSPANLYIKQQSSLPWLLRWATRLVGILKGRQPLLEPWPPTAKAKNIKQNDTLWGPTPSYLPNSSCSHTISENCKMKTTLIMN